MIVIGEKINGTRKKVKEAIVAGEIEASSVGLVDVNETTCLACHNDESPTFQVFNYEEQSAEIAHPVPETE